ncbi:hypothetical protein ASPWEDRAFT_166417 [Aspergillus wentii DTO 134E9]|uniref:Uncharacterized protein n=1 Tax=Aspergillus wentii DTO 134E9 TaxID=1073089 RepID=A0A1L9RZG2_ASPWE|nr:uncharacterized protein ASPWEDRAFT_166417 [Aspergillus wentii DTO 134E9]KAI9932763.1 hypothetical protein MW887_009013 [Aspergillus wentii]OJJ40341.1 hypothetical protein ASPWEDRAFT_166417 [Aspergillus wentii DTO 134E9]
MTSSFPTREFYGGAIGGIIPQGWIDASDLREVPDHQELYLSPTTLSNMIIEINQRVPAEEALSAYDIHHPTTPRGGAPATQETIDKAAALYHLNDLRDEGDTLEVVTAPEAVSLPRFRSAGRDVDAYKGVVSFTTPKGQRRGGGGGGGESRVPVSVDETAAGSSVAGSQTSKLSCHYLLARLEEQETDLVVFFNVPRDEFDAKGDPRGLSREEELATEAIAKMVENLEVKDWGLFV